jgi:hypothetical protein
MEDTIQKWEYMRLTVGYRSEGEVYFAVSNDTEVIHRDDDAGPNDLHNYIGTLGYQGWELVSVYQDVRNNEIYHFKRPIQ